MSLPDLTGQNIENTYQRLVQTDGTNFYDGTGSIVNFGSDTFPYTGSAIITGSLEIIGPFTASGFNYPTIAGNEGEAIVIDQDGNLNFAYPKAITERVKNVSGEQLPKGTPVHATGSGTSGNIVGVIAADAGDPTKMPATYVLNETLDDESEGEALAVGYIQGVNTTGLIEGEVVYVAVGGGWTQTKPTGSALIQNLGIVTKVGSNGSGVVLGAGRSNDIPNIQSGYTWVGNSNGVPTAIPTSSLVVTNAISSSYTLTASYIQNAQTASYVETSQTASYVLNAVSASYILNAISSSFASTASYIQNAQTASYVLNAVSASYAQNAQTASHLNSLTQNVEILGNVTIYGTASVDILVTNYQSSSIIYSSGSTKFGDTLDDTHEFTGSIFTTGSISSTNTITATTGSFSYLQGNSPIVVGDPITFQQAITASSISASVIYGNASNLTGVVSSSFSSTSSFTPNAIVTASATPGNYTIRLTKGDGSFFDVALTAPAPIPPPVTDTGSFFTNATLSSDRIVFTKGDRSSLFLSLTSSYVLISQTSSFTQTSSFNNFTQSYYTDSASFDTRINNFSIDTSSLVTTSSFNTFTQSIQSSVDSLTNSTSSYVLISQTSSFVLNSQTSSMLEPYVLISVTSSMLEPYILSSQTSSFVQNSQTSSFVQNSQTSSMLEPYVLVSQTSSFVKNNQTSSFVLNSQTSSMLEPYVLTSVTGSMLEPYVLSSQTSSFIVSSQTSSFVQNSQTSSFVQNNQTSSMLEPYVLTIVTSSMLAPYVLNSQTSSFVQNSQTSSMTVLSSSFASTASFTPNTIVTATAISTVGGFDIGSRIASNWSSTGPTLTAGQVVYLSGSTQWAQAQANITGSSYGMLGVVTNAESQTEVLIEGTIKISGSALSGGLVGQPVYLSAVTAGQVVLTPPSSSNQVVRIIGYVTKADSNIMYFRPDISFATLT